MYHSPETVALSHLCKDDTPTAISVSGDCMTCGEHIPEEIADAALLIPKLDIKYYKKLYE